MQKSRNNFLKTIILRAIRGYQKLISPYLIKSCRFYPTCSEYTHAAIEKHGIFKGSIKSVWRILRCNPFSKGGFDPVNGIKR